MKKPLLLLLALFNLATGFGQSAAGDGPHKQLIIRGVTLINGNGAPPRGPIDIVVEGNKITKVAVVGYPGVAISEKVGPF